MKLLNTQDIEKLGIQGRVNDFCAENGHPRRTADATQNLFTKLVQWGWVDGIGRPLTWHRWNKQPA